VTRDPARVPGGPLPLTMRQSAVAAIVVLALGLGAALLTPVAAAVEARRVTPPGAVVAGQAAVLPAEGWTVESQDAGAVLLSRAGARMLVRWQPGTPPDPSTGLSSLAKSTQNDVPDASQFGGVRQFTTPSGDPGYLAPFAAPGSTGAIALVRSADGEVTVQALAPSTTFSAVSDDLLSMITSIRIRRGGAA
jgi:hypothetical protein